MPSGRRTLPARRAFQEKFNSDEERSAFYREIGEKGNTERLVLSGEEAHALRSAYALLGSIFERITSKPCEGEAL